MTTFKNEPPADFSVEANRQSFSRALEAAAARIKAGEYMAYPCVAGEERETSDTAQSLDPSAFESVLGTVHYADAALTEKAIAYLAEHGGAWQLAPYEERVAVVRKAAALMRERRLELTALIVREAGKPWKEADADVTEAIDFCEYYGLEMLRLGPPRRLAQIPGEEDIYFYKPRGIAAVIAPWNFPLAIACGMTVASLICGNPTILKPAEQTSLIAFQFARILFEAGVPKGAFAFLPGRGEVAGRTLVNHPATALVCFTGSKAVGLEILRSTAEMKPGQNHIKRSILELGGKNCIIVDEDADLDEAIKGIVYSAFGYSGQKCSACSRVAAVGEIYEPLLARLKEAASDLLIGSASDPATLVGPVIDQESLARINLSVAEAKKTETLLFESKVLPSGGYFAAPAIFRDVDVNSSVWREEIFGPVLACRQAADFDDALKLANQSQYALTGALFSRSPSRIQRALREFQAGNIYINRGCTGALVCRHPFGGFKMSGVGSKAGGPDYLLQFMEPVAVSENTMRRGFAPGL